MLEYLKRDLLSVLDKMVAAELVKGATGTACVRDYTTNLIVTPPTHTRYDILYGDMIIDDLVVADMNGRVVEGRRPSSDLSICIEIFKKRKEIFGIICAHSVYAVALSSLGIEIPMITNELAEVTHDKVPIIPMIWEFNEKAIKMIANAFEDRDVAVVRNNSFLALGTTLNRAFACACITEDSSKIYCVAKHLGEPDLLPRDKWKEIREEGRNIGLAMGPK